MAEQAGGRGRSDDREEKLREALTRLETLIENVQQGVLFENQQRRVHFVNRAFCDLFGIASPESIIGADCARLAEQAKILFPDPEDFCRAIEKRLDEGKIVFSEEMILSDGRTFERDYIPVVTKGVHHGSYWVYRDRTEARRREERLNRINAGLLGLGHDHGRNLQILTGLAGELLDADCALYSRLEGDRLCVKGEWNAPLDLKTEDAPQGHICFDLIQRNDDQPFVVRRLQDTPYAETDPNVSAYGLLTYIGYPVRYDGKARGSLCVVYTRDNEPSAGDLRIIGILAAAVAQEEERALAAETLWEREQYITSILDSVDEGFLVVDRDFRILTANRVFCNRFGARPEEVVGSHCHAVVRSSPLPCHEHGDDCPVKRTFDSGEPHTVPKRIKDAGGNTVYIETKAFPLEKDASGKVISAIETSADISEKHLLETERLKTQKLEAIGTLAGGIAHDFNNLLQGVFGYISMAKMDLDPQQETFAMLAEAEQALRTSINLAGQLLTFSKGGKPVKKVIALLPVIENAAKFALSGASSDYRLNSDERLWNIEADEGQIWQVVQNIVLNAHEAMSENGTVEIAVENQNIPKGGQPLLPKGGKFVRIAIQDSGKGITEPHLARIFDPYFTTKQKGSGLGLATSYSIVKNHGGAIEVASEAGEGSTFFIYLPASRAEVQKAELSAVSPGSRAKILLMDDEPVVRAVAARMISSLGHEAEVVEDGQEAIEKFRQARESGEPFDVVILDLTIRRGMGGESAIRNLREIDPAIKAIVSSGYADNPVVSDFRSHGFKGILKKPYTLDDLQEALQAFLEAEQ
jgi:PAS domain S-box-containing protein